jgi:steroid delta-isomerase-like uncharacterized protein
MSVETQKGLVQRFFAEVFNQQDTASATALIAASFIAHHPAFPDGIRGSAGIMQMLSTFRAGLPDLRYTVDDLIAEGDKVAARWSAGGSHQGVFLGVPPSGKAVTITGIDIFRIADYQLVEAWVNSDFLGLLQQIGAIPAAGQART